MQGLVSFWKHLHTGAPAGRRSAAAAPTLLTAALLAAALLTTVAAAPPLHARPAAQVEVSTPGQALIGEDHQIALSFANAGSAAGYGPYVDLYLPARGADGRTAGGPCDGITFVAVDPAAPVVVSAVLEAPACGGAANRVHPLTGAAIPAAADDFQLVVLELTFGNVEPLVHAPPLGFAVTVHLSDHADVRPATDPDDCDLASPPLTVYAAGGFRWGADPRDNPDTDPPLPHPPAPFPPDAAADVHPRVFHFGATVEDPDTATPGSCFDGVDNGGDGLTDFDDPDCGGKEYLGPEDETATGPSHPQRYRVTVDVAAGQTLTELEVEDLMPAGLQFLAVESVQVRRPPPAGAPLVPAVRGTSCTPGVDYLFGPPSGSGPGGRFTVTFCSLTGTPQPDDAEIVFEFYVPEFDARGEPILDPGTCEPAALDNDVRARGRWRPVDPRDRAAAGGPDDLCVSSDESRRDHTLLAKCVAIQKGVEIRDETGAPGATPGDELLYTLAVQVSDYVPTGDLTVTDVLSDGQTFLPVPAPHLVGDGAFTVPDTLTVADGTPGCGETTLTFDLSAQLRAAGLDADGVVAGWSGGLTFAARIDSDYRCPPPAGDRSVDKHDPVTNDVELDGNAYDAADGGRPTGTPTHDDSGAGVSIVGAGLEKSIHAVLRHGEAEPEVPPSSLLVSAGDAVTYRLRYELPSCDAEVMDVRDVLPRPVLDVDAPVLGSNGWDWSGSGVFDCNDPPGFPVPLSGNAQYGPDHTAPDFTGGPPCTGLVSQNTAANSLLFRPGTFHGDDDEPCVLDLLYTLEATCEPFADGLFLANRAIECEGSSVAHDPRLCQEASTRFRYAAPDLELSKGVVAACCRPEVSDPTGGDPPVGDPPGTFDPADVHLRRPVPLRCGGATGDLDPATAAPVPFSAPGGACPRFASPLTSPGLDATPVAAGLPSGLDPGELVTFAVVVENVGSDPDGAFGVTVEDLLPLGAGFQAAGFGPAGINLCVTDGTGTPLPYSGGGGPVLAGNRLTVALDDPGAGATPPGSLGAPTAPPGRNLAVITYDLRLAPDASVGSCFDNTARVAHYRAGACDTNLAEAGFGGPRSADAQVCRDPVPAKSLTVTSEAHTAGGDPADLAIGEIARYRLELHLPEGTTNFLRLVDALPPGLELLAATVRVEADTAPGLPPQLAGAWPGPLVAPTASLAPFTVSGDPLGGGQTVVLDVGTLDNRDRDCDHELLVVELEALVLNAAVNQDGARKTNRFHAEIGKKGRFKRLEAEPVVSRIVEPRLTLDKRLTSVPANPGPGDEIGFTLLFTNTGGATAFEAVLRDVLPPCLTLVPGSPEVEHSRGAGGGTVQSAGRLLGLSGVTVPPGASVELTFSARITCPDPGCDVLTNRAFVLWTSLPGAGSDPNPTASVTPGASGRPRGERTGSGGVNDYRASAEASLPTLCDEPPDLTVEKAMTDGFLSAGGRHPAWEYTLTVTNLGPGPTTGPVRLEDTLPPGFELVPARSGGGGWTCREQPPGTVVCEHPGTPALQAGDTAAVPVVLTRTQPGDLWTLVGGDVENCVTVSTPGEERTGNNDDCLTQPCPNPDDPAAAYYPPYLDTCDGAFTCDPAVCREVDPAECESAPPGNRQWTWTPCGCMCPQVVPPDLEIDKAFTLPAAVPGSVSVTVTNVGNGPTTGRITVTDVLPPGIGFSFAQGGDPGWSCHADPPGPSGQEVTCTHPGPLRPGDSLTLGFIVSGDAGEETVNCATVTTDGDADAGNDEDCSCPDAALPRVHYVSRRPFARVIPPRDDVLCPPGQVPFFSDCGWGCVGDEDPCVATPVGPASPVLFRRGPDGAGSLLLRVAPPEAAEVDEVRLDLPRRTARSVEPRNLPAGWALERGRRGVVLRGPATPPPLHLKLALGGADAPDRVGLRVLSGGETVQHAGRQAVALLPPVEPADRLEGLLALPSRVAPGETVRLRPLDPARTPPGGRWTFAGRGPDGGSLEGTVTGQHFPWVDCPLPTPVIWNVPLEWPAGVEVLVSYTDPWGDPVITEAPAEELEIAPPEDVPATDAGGEAPGPRLTGGSDPVVPGGDACACGHFPDPEAQAALVLDGELLGAPVTGATGSVRVRLPESLAPGPHAVTGRLSAGFPPGDVWRFEAIRIRGSLDQRELFQGGSTEMRLTVEGTERPVSLRVTNFTPGVISLEGGDEQVITTSGGADNAAARTVRARSRGDFNLQWELDLPACPCDGEGDGEVDGTEGEGGEDDDGEEPPPEYYY